MLAGIADNGNGGAIVIGPEVQNVDFLADKESTTIGRNSADICNSGDIEENRVSVRQSHHRRRRRFDLRFRRRRPTRRPCRKFCFRCKKAALGEGETNCLLLYEAENEADIRIRSKFCAWRS